MKNKITVSWILLLGLAAGISSCHKDKVNILNTGNFTDTSGGLKSAMPTGVIMGMEIDDAPFLNDANYRATAAANATQVTFGYEMKEGAIQQNDGSLNFTNADALFNAATNAGLSVYGHNLCWYENQNATYLNSVVGSGSGSSAPNAVTNGSFESWSGSTPVGWGYYNQGNGNFSQGSGAGNVEDGSYSIASAVTGTSYAAGSGSGWHLQLASTFASVAGDTYEVSFWAKASVPGCVYQGEGNNGGSGTTYTGDQPLATVWTQYSYSFQASAASTTISFDMADNPTGSVIYLDNVIVTDETAAAANSTPTAEAARVDSVLHLWINGMVTHYAGKVPAWDVVNEPMADGSSGIRGSKNTSVPNGATDYFFWSDYLGRDFALNAFNYAHAADPNALLFINDYALESNTAKLDSLIAYVKELQGLGAHIDGIGTEMHININTNPAGIDAMFQALAATGLKIRISELDVSINPYSKPQLGATSIAQEFGYQATTYQYVVQSYLKNVPGAQQYGITVWGVNDPNSWLYANGNDYPLLFDANYAKKPAFSGFLQGLK